MKTVARSFRLSGPLLLAVLAGALFVLLPPPDLSAQSAAAKPDPPYGQRLKHDWSPPGPPWKHELEHPPGNPCLESGAPPPCPPGQFLKHDIMGNQNGHQSALLLQLVTEVEEGSLTMATPVPPQAQHRLYEALVDGAAPWLTELASALSPEGNEEAWSEGVALVAALQALPYGDAYLTQASEAFNAFLDASSEAFLAEPTPEFLVVHAFLGTLVQEALSPPEA
jgi:hypothetical protein